jgi:hypothetical protein
VSVRLACVGPTTRMRPLYVWLVTGAPWHTSSTSSGMTSWRAIYVIFQVSQMRRRTKSRGCVVHYVTPNSIEH